MRFFARVGVGGGGDEGELFFSRGGLDGGGEVNGWNVRMSGGGELGGYIRMNSMHRISHWLDLDWRYRISDKDPLSGAMQ